MGIKIKVKITPTNKNLKKNISKKWKNLPKVDLGNSPLSGEFLNY